MNNPLRSKIFLVGLLLLLFLAGFFMLELFFIPPSQIASTRVVYVKKGTPLGSIAVVLEREGILRNRYIFIAMATLLGKKREMKAGEYEFHTRMLPFEVLNHLVKGQVKRHLVTIPEGYNLSQIGRLLEDLGIVGRETFLQKATSFVDAASLGLAHFIQNQGAAPSPGKSGFTLEGYLFPETYHFIKETNSEEVIRTMVHQFQKVFGADLIERAYQLGITPKDAVILASIIEKETSLPEEKPLVSAVFHNRLKKKIPLQSDPTVIYGIKDFDGNLTREHLLRPTPYNTYLFIGLPPTPICNPGKDSLVAALNPASVPYFYFVSKNDGSHHFSEQIEEHQKAVGKYQKNSLRKN